MTDTTSSEPWGKNVLVEFEDRIAWVALNRPEKRNAMSPPLNDEMLATLDALEIDDRCGVVVLTGVGRIVLGRHGPQGIFPRARRPALRAAAPRPALGLAVAVEASHGLSASRPSPWSTAGASAARSRRWSPAISPSPPRMRSSASPRSTGASFPAATSRASVVATDEPARCHVLRHDRRDLRRAQGGADGRWSTRRCRADRLRERTRALAKTLLGKNPTVLRAAKQAVRAVQGMAWELSDEYLMAKGHQARFLDPDQGRSKGLTAVPRRKVVPAGLSPYRRGE